MVLLAEADAFTQLGTAIITVIGGIVTGAVTAGLPIWLTWRHKYKEEKAKYQEEQVKHRDEHKTRIKAEELQKDAVRREEQAEDAVTELQRNLAAMEQLLPHQGETMDDRVFTTVQELIKKVDQLTGAVNQLRREVDELKAHGGGTNAPPSPPSQTFEDLRRQLEECIASRGLRPVSQNRVVWNSPNKGKIPVLIIRRGAQNHRVLFPDGTDDTVPVTELGPL